MTFKITNIGWDNYRIESNIKIPSWDFIKNAEEVNYISEQWSYSCNVKITSGTKIDYIEYILKTHFCDSITEVIKMTNTLQELNFKLRRLEKEVNPSIKERTKTLLGI